MTNKLIFGLALLSAASVFQVDANAESRFYIPDTPVTPGEEVRLPICIDNDIPIVAFNFDVVFPEGITPVATGKNPRWTRVPERYPKGMVYDDETGEEKEQNYYTYSFTQNLLEPNRARFLAYSNENLPMATGEGPVAYVIARVSPDFKGETTGQVLSICIADYKTDAVPVPEDIDYNLYVNVESVEVTPSEGLLEVGKELQLNATLLPAGAEGTSLSWTSSDESVATVSDLGVVTAVAPGDVSISVKARDREAVARIKVIGLQPASLAILPTGDVAVPVGESVELSVSVTPDGAEAPLTWTSSGPDVATVDEKGVVTGVSPGETVIEVSATNLLTNEVVKALKTIKVNPVEVTEVAISAPDDATGMSVGDKLALTATVAPENATYKDVTWASLKPEVATVDEAGVVTALAAGEATITATAVNGVKGEYILTVKNVEAEGITLSVTEITSREGDKVQLEATVLPANTTFPTVTWSSDNESVATVDADGLVTCVSMGEAVITATCGNVSATCAVTVTAPLPSAMAFNVGEVSLKVKETAGVGVILSPEYAETVGITYSSSDENVATVSGEGLEAVITAVALGEATITATSDNGLVAEMTVKVVPTEVEGITLTVADNNLYVGDTAEVTAVVDPDDATYKELVWTSSDDKIATVDQTGIVTGVAAGEVTITATAVNGVKGECTLTVKNVEAEGITLSMTEFTSREGDKVQLEATVLPANTTFPTVTWSSDNESVATVDADGMVTCVSMGEAVITATCGDFSATCEVTVTAPLPSAMAFNVGEVSLKAKETAGVGVILSPEYAETVGITYTSSDENVATVSGEGLEAVITAVALGEATITATSDNGLVAEMTVKVVPTEVEGITLTVADNNLYVGDTTEVTAVVDPDDATYKELVWTSSDDKIATVDQTGIVTGVAAGEATITATAVNGVKGEITVFVQNVMVEEIILDQTLVEAVGGTEVQLAATVLPENATDKKILWSSSNEEIATVDSTGLVTLLRNGTVVITAVAADGSGIMAECVFDVQTGIEMVISSNEEASVYLPDGTLLKARADREYLRQLSKGLYIIRTAGKTVKIFKR